MVRVKVKLQVKIKVEKSLYMSGQALMVPGFLVSHISRLSAHEGSKVASPTHRPPLSPENISCTHFCYRLSRPKGHSAAGMTVSMKISNETLGNRTRDLTVYREVPQISALRRD
jgi:hypothetical protein